jgi:hypothetical protein
MTAWLLTVAGQLNPSPRFRTLVRQIATNRDTDPKLALSSGSLVAGRTLAFGFQWYPSSGIGRSLVAGALVAAGRLVAGGPVEVPRCHHTSIKGDPCPETPTHRATWPTRAHRPWSATYCETHAEEVRPVPGCEVNRLEGSVDE